MADRIAVVYVTNGTSISLTLEENLKEAQIRLVGLDVDKSLGHLRRPMEVQTNWRCFHYSIAVLPRNIRTANSTFLQDT